MTKLRYRFPCFSDPVGEAPLDPPHGEWKAVVRRMGCDDETAKAVAFHRRAIKALREAEETGDLRHVKDLAKRVSEGELDDAALPTNFHKRLLILFHDQKARGPGAPRRSDYWRQAVRSSFRFYKKAVGWERALEWLAKEFGVSPSGIEKIVSGEIARSADERLDALETLISIWDPDFLRFFEWVAEGAHPEND